MEKKPVDPVFYEKLRKLYAEKGGNLYTCCKKLGLKGGRDYEPMSDAERMVCRLTNSGLVVWKAGAKGLYPEFQEVNAKAAARAEQ